MLRRLCKSIIVLALVVTSVSVALPAGEAHASCDDAVMGFPTWYRGLDCNDGHVNLDGKKLSTGEGVAEKTKKARTALTSAIIGLVLAVSAAFVISFIVSRMK